MNTKKYEILLVAYIDITNIEQVINWSEQGWTPYDANEYHSLVFPVSKSITVETDLIELYVDGINKLSVDIHVEWYEEIK